MIRRPPLLLGFFAVWFVPGISDGQDASSPDIVVSLNEGIYYYLEGQRDEYTLAVAIERFTTVLQHQPDNTTALLFRALAHGRTALLRLDEKRSHQETVGLFKRILDIRTDPERLSRLEAEKVRAEAILASETAPLAQRNIAQSLLRYYDVLVEELGRQKERTVEQLEVERTKAVQRSHAVARREREQYLSMIADLKRLVQALDRPEAVIRLLEVVASAKVARIDEEEARDTVRGHISPSDASGPVKALRDAATTRLTEAAGILEALLGDQLEQRSRIRTKFFLGVIRYRQGVPLRAESEPPGLDDRGRSMLQEAERLMAELADDAATDDAWRSYAAFYLGIVIPFRAASETDADKRDAILQEAERRLTQASEIDAQLERRSNIPDLVRRQREVIAELREAPPAAPQRKDLSLSLYAGARWDSNVVLLGERTDLPRDISDERDFGFTAGASLDYTYDITEQLTLGLQARTSQLWNCEVHEFDQQTYGGSVALQHEAMREVDEFGPVYLTLQYDFDYTLLGRSEFLQSHALTPSVGVYWAGQRAQTDVFLTYEIRDYSEPLYDRRFNRDGTYLTIGVSQRVKMTEMTAVYTDLGWEPWGSPGDESLAQEDPDYPRRYMTPYAAAGYSQDATAGDEFDRKAVALLLGVEMPLPWGWEFDASASFEWERYPQGSLVDFHRRVRRDLVQEYGLALSRTFVLRAGNQANRYTPAIDRLLMTVHAHATWTDDDSNVVDRFGQAIFSYDRAVYGLSVVFTFN
ncbi:MAG: hypothetical protein JSU86_11695 [Phycisphaerales bacterium]|nr:MAG: hypothetical protein JSU86_11695 [Phycisphaerales bacterium]